MARLLSCNERVIRLNMLVSCPTSSRVVGVRGIGDWPSATCLATSASLLNGFVMRRVRRWAPNMPAAMMRAVRRKMFLIIVASSCVTCASVNPIWTTPDRSVVEAFVFPSSSRIEKGGIGVASLPFRSTGMAKSYTCSSQANRLPSELEMERRVM